MSPEISAVRIIYFEGGKALGYLIYSVEQDIAAGRPVGQRLLDPGYRMAGSFSYVLT